jgi:hypothetical protein
MSKLETNARRSQWTDEEITLLKYKFAAGKRIKTIAEEIGRSETAVNKFLSRTGIRARKKSRDMFAELTSSQKRQNRSEISMGSDATNQMYPDEVQAGINDVVSYLKSKGYRISRFHTRDRLRRNRTYGDYVYDGHPISGIRLLLFANRLRTEEKLPIFTVASLMW